MITRCILIARESVSQYQLVAIGLLSRISDYTVHPCSVSERSGSVRTSPRIRHTTLQQDTPVDRKFRRFQSWAWMRPCNRRKLSVQGGGKTFCKRLSIACAIIFELRCTRTQHMADLRHESAMRSPSWRQGGANMQSANMI